MDMRSWILAACISCGAAASDPPNRVIFLHYDYMVAGDHSHAPDPRAIELVVEAFRRQGITLHIDPQHTAIPERRVVTPGPVDPACAGPDAVSLRELRETYFRPHGNHDWHYAVFAHRAFAPDVAHAARCPPDPLCRGLPDPSMSGFAEIGGRNFVVTFGGYQEAGETVPVGTEAATLMHELGHNLGLLHGGREACVNQKPNYISVMNYTYQLNGIVVGERPGSSALKLCSTDRDCGRGAMCESTTDILGADICVRVDYSNRELPPLNEGALDERAGVSGAPADTDLVLYWAPGPVQMFGPSFGPIDWNGDAATSTGIEADVNNDVGFTLLTGYDDWAHVKAYLGTPAYAKAASHRHHPLAICTH